MSKNNDKCPVCGRKLPKDSWVNKSFKSSPLILKIIFFSLIVISVCAIMLLILMSL